jgi:type I restriction enzyme, S subunit
MEGERRSVTFQKLIDDGLLEIGDGYRAQNRELGGTGPIFLRAGHVTDTHIDFTGVDRFHEHVVDRVRTKFSMVGDTIITTKGNSTGRTAFVSKRLPVFVYSPHLSFWRSRDPAKLCNGFLRYWSRSAQFTGQLSGMKVSTDMAPYLSLTDQRRLTITLPPIAEQRAIASVLGALDDKIDLNRRMCQTLEEMARALFKSWFVDFDPVRAKMEGRDPGLPKEIADLFPSRLVDSELGPIPEGWRVAATAEIADVIYGAPFASSRFNTKQIGAPLVRIRDLATQAPDVWTDEEHPKGYRLSAGDIVIGMDGEFRAHLWAGPTAWLNQRVCVFRPRDGYCRVFVRNAVAAPLAFVEATETATTVIHLGKSDIDGFRFVVAPRATHHAFSKISTPWYERFVAAKRESATLAALRDTLLPKLISGELRVPASLGSMQEVAS